jgi:threonine dehydratase
VPAPLPYDDVTSAARRLAGSVRPLAVSRAEAGLLAPVEVVLALELLQHTGSFKARGAYHFLAARRGALPEAGVTIASGGNAGLACAWAARAHGVRATVFVPETAPAVKVARLREYGADVRLVGTEYAEALLACQEHAAATGALQSHAYDSPLVAAGAGTLMLELVAAAPGLDTVVVAVGGGGLFAGVATVAAQHGIRTVAVEPDGCRALQAAVEAGAVVDVPVRSVAADSLGARRCSATALAVAQAYDTRCVTVPDDAIERARTLLWEELRLAAEHGAATAAAGLLAGAYVPAEGERVAVVVCGGNTDPATLGRPAA